MVPINENSYTFVHVLAMSLVRKTKFCHMRNDNSNASVVLNLDQMKQQFPKAFQLVMNLEFKPTYVDRSLYDRFDQANVIVTVDYDDSSPERMFGFRVHTKSVSDGEVALWEADDKFTTRPQAEVAAFTEAFKCLQENLK